MAAAKPEVRYAIVVARFYSELADRLVSSATRVFEAAGADDVDDEHERQGDDLLGLADGHGAKPTRRGA